MQSDIHHILIEDQILSLSPMPHLWDKLSVPFGVWGGVSKKNFSTLDHVFRRRNLIIPANCVT